MAEYEAKFTSLKRFEWGLVATEKMQVDQFFEGLFQPMKQRLASQVYTVMADVVKVASRDERVFRAVRGLIVGRDRMEAVTEGEIMIEVTGRGNNMVSRLRVDTSNRGTEWMRLFLRPPCRGSSRSMITPSARYVPDTTQESAGGPLESVSHMDSQVIRGRIAHSSHDSCHNSSRVCASGVVNLVT